MENTEDINEWQQTEEQHPSSPEASGWNVVMIKENYLEVQVQDEQSSSSSSSYNPPTFTEDSQLSPPQQIVPTTMDDLEDGTSSSLTASSSVSDDEGENPTPLPPSLDWRFRVVNEGKKLLRLRFEAVRAEFERVASKVRNCAIWTGMFWSITYVTGAATAAVLVAFVYVGIRRRRRRVGRQSVDHSVYLLREKDEKIGQLLLQIAQLNEVLSSRRKVPVHRIGG